MEIVVFILCIIIGSFINVVAYSLPLKLGFIYRRSYCDSCLHILSFLDMIPILSFIFLKGKCRYCHQRINMRYSVIELLCGFIGVLFYCLYEPMHFFIMFVFFVIIILISLIDIDTMFVYDGMIVLLFIISIFLYPYYQFTFIERIIGMFVLTLPMFLFNIYKEAFGGGDIKLFCVLGLLFGVQGILHIFVYSTFIASFYSFFMMFNNKIDMNSYIPFVPFIGLGVFSYILYGNIFVI